MARISVRKYMNINKEWNCSSNQINFTQDQKDEMLEAFTLFDQEGTGLVPTKNLGKVMRSLGQVLTVCEETDIVAYFAQEKCYSIDFITFVKFLSTRYRHFDEEDELSESFRRFDKEDKGYVLVKDLKDMLMTMGEPLSAQEVDEWLADGKPFTEKGKLNYEEFAAFMLSK